jgi:hypothetical protein
MTRGRPRSPSQACVECLNSGEPADSRGASSAVLAGGLAIDARGDLAWVARLPNLCCALENACAVGRLARGT